MPIDSPQVSRTTSEFSETMSDDEFAAYLKKKGLKEKDYSILIGNIIIYAQLCTIMISQFSCNMHWL